MNIMSENNKILKSNEEAILDPTANNFVNTEKQHISYAENGKFESRVERPVEELHSYKTLSPVNKSKFEENNKKSGDGNKK